MDAGLLLVGSRPGSAEPPRSFNKTYKVDEPAPRSSFSKYQERLFSGPGTRTYGVIPVAGEQSTQSPTSNYEQPSVHSTKQGQRPRAPSDANKATAAGRSPVQARSSSPAHRAARTSPKSEHGSGPRPSTPKRGVQSTAPSYVDETLFGPRLTEPDFNAPWDDGKKPVIVMDATDFKLQRKLREQRERDASQSATRTRSSPIVASHNVLHGKNRKTAARGGARFTPSQVDELLFGDGHSGGGRASPLAGTHVVASRDHDPLNTGQFSVSGSRPPSREGRPPSPGRRPASPGRTRAGGHAKHQPSYVDETLFGEPPTEANFPAPWEDKEQQRGRPLLFDAYDHRVTVNHAARPASGRSTPGRPKSRPRSAKKTDSKPAPWR